MGILIRAAYSRELLDKSVELSIDHLIPRQCSGPSTSTGADLQKARGPNAFTRAAIFSFVKAKPQTFKAWP